MEAISVPPPPPPPLPPRRPGPIQMGRGMKETQAASTLDKVKELEYKIKKMMEEKNELLNGRTETDQMEDHHPSKEFVIAFVESLEKADQYYDFQNYLIRKIKILPDHHQGYIFGLIVMSRERKEKFEKVDDKVIQRAIDMHLFIKQQIQEVRNRYAFRKRLTKCGTITLQSRFVDDIKAVGSFELYPRLSSEELEMEIKNYKLFFNLSPRSQAAKVTKKIYMEKNEKELKHDLAIYEKEEHDYVTLQRKDEYADIHTTYNIVFRSRQGQYVMDQDPRVELEKLMKSRPSLYGFLNLEVSKMKKFDPESEVGYDSQKKVLVFKMPSDVTKDATEQDFWEGVIKKCGEIVSIDRQSVNNCDVAYVTFKKFGGLRQGMGFLSRNMRLQHVRVEGANSIPHPSETGEYSEYISEGHGAASGIKVVKVLDSRMFEKALKKYDELVTRYEGIRASFKEKSCLSKAM